MKRENKMLQLRAAYRENIHHLESMLNVNDQDISGEIGEVDIQEYLYYHRIREALNHCRVAYDFLGLRRGEAVPKEWLIDLSSINREIFLRYMNNKEGFTEISCQLGIDRLSVKKAFKHSLIQVMKNAGRE